MKFIGGRIGSNSKLSLSRHFKDTKKVLLVLNLLLSLSAYSQVHYTIDTVEIDEVVISSENISKFQTGAKIEKVAVKDFEMAQDGNLEQLLLKYTTIPVKSIAGSFSTLHFRGTSADHTSINFEGLNINSLTLGHSNVSNVPLFLFDELGIQFGSSTAVNGSGSIGGAIHLGIKNYWVKGVKAEFKISNGSFGEQLYGAKLFYGNGKIEGVTRIYSFQKENDFVFHNVTYDWEKKGEWGEDTQHNANIKNKGLLQEINYKFKSNTTLKTKVWLEDNWHLVQQNMQTNALQPKLKETYNDEHFRLWSMFEHEQNNVKYRVGAGYVYDNGVSNESTDKISTQRYEFDGNVEHVINNNISYKTGVKYVRILPKVYAYDSTLTHENRTDFYFSYYQKLFQKLKATVNIRKGFVSEFSAPFTPALGLSYMAYSSSYALLKFNGNLAYSYRVPTFNDRFWVPGGNPELKPEEGVNYELGAKYTYSKNAIKFKISANAFYLNVNHWLLWNPGDKGYWEAQNVAKVKSKGIELQSDVTIKLNELKINPGLNYTYNPCIRAVSDARDSVAVGRQLEYVPKNSVSSCVRFGFKSFYWGASYVYHDEQFTDYKDENILPKVGLFNLNAGYNYKLNASNRFSICLKVNNLLNVDYQSSWQLPMPRRNYLISIKYNFK